MVGLSSQTSMTVDVIMHAMLPEKTHRAMIKDSCGGPYNGTVHVSLCSCLMIKIAPWARLIR
jgi:hypothetical protein